MKLKPFGALILVRPDDPPDMLRGMHLPSSARDAMRRETTEGTIVSVGPEGPRTKLTNGDRITFTKYAGANVRTGERDKDGADEVLLVMTEADIYCIHTD